MPSLYLVKKSRVDLKGRLVRAVFSMRAFHRASLIFKQYFLTS
jgi:hypothetical protein